MTRSFLFFFFLFLPVFCNQEFFSGLESVSTSADSSWYQCQIPDILLVQNQNGGFAQSIIYHDPGKEESLEVRKRNFGILRKLNFSRDENEVLSSFHLGLLEDFSLHPMGACMVARVIMEDLELYEKGLFSIRKPEGKESFLSDALTGEFTEEGFFEQDKVFLIRSVAGFGAWGQSGLISFGQDGFKDVFITGQKIDSLAIVAHEFGHTRFGDRESGENLQTEAMTVRNYENPVRVFDGFLPRKIYYSLILDRYIDIETMTEHEGRP